MKTVPVEEAVGLILCHDITEIVPGVLKGPAFRRGHKVTPEDIPHLLRLGKEHLYVWAEADNCMVHEDEAAARIASVVAGPGVEYGVPKEGRINFCAAAHGLLRINLDLLLALNSVEHVTIATGHTMQEVAQGRPVAGTRVIPLAVPEETMLEVERLCRESAAPLLEVLPFSAFKIGVITTGSEVYRGRIKDGFGPILRKKIAAWGSEIIFHEIVPDEPEHTVQAMERALSAGVEMLLISGGMSVDPDDKTPAAIRAAGCDVVIYGAPVYPGAMFMLAYKGAVPVFGLPGCVMYHRASVFDLVAPRILAGLRVTRKDVLELAHGGLCEGCPACHYPNCGFGKH